MQCNNYTHITYNLSIEIHLFSKSPADIVGFGLRRMAGGSPGKGALGISIYVWETNL